MHNFEVVQQIPAERAQNILTNALEGGSNYWYTIKEVVQPTERTFEDKLWTEERAKNPNWYHTTEIPLNKGGALIFSTISEERTEEARNKEEAKRYRLDLEAIARGLRIMAFAYERHFSDFMAENDDATTGDVFLQCCLFGEVIYG